VVLNGIGVHLVGLSLASAILMGSSVFVGSMAPLLLRDPQHLATSTGHLILFCNLLIVAGVLLCAWAGDLRGRGDSGGMVHARTVAVRGILICLAAGLLSTFLNLALSYGDVISRFAIREGSSEFNAANAVWSLAVSLGALPSLVWCSWRLSRMRKWELFSGPRRRRNALLCVSMGLLWIAGTVFYGAAAGKLGPLGPVVGWPIYMSGIILTASFWGWVTGEWRGVSRFPVAVMSAGVVIIVAAIALLGGVR
jgi:L-rhamnose-H+ transport protein